jgi:hypothetical protein
VLKVRRKDINCVFIFRNECNRQKTATLFFSPFHTTSLDFCCVGFSVAFRTQRHRRHWMVLVPDGNFQKAIKLDGEKNFCLLACLLVHLHSSTHKKPHILEKTLKKIIHSVMSCESIFFLLFLGNRRERAENVLRL